MSTDSRARARAHTSLYYIRLISTYVHPSNSAVLAKFRMRVVIRNELTVPRTWLLARWAQEYTRYTALDFPGIFYDGFALDMCIAAVRRMRTGRGREREGTREREI